MRRFALITAVLWAATVPVEAQTDWADQIFRESANAGGAGSAKAQKAALARPGPGKSVDKSEAAKKALLHVRPSLPPGKDPAWQWQIKKASWSAEDHRGFEEFIRAIGESECKTVHECITSPAANPRYHTSNPPNYPFRADCADLPYFLRAYYAWKNDLPYSFSVKYSWHRAPANPPNVTGNQIIDRFDIVGPGPDARRALPAISQFVSSEHFRIPPGYTGQQLPDYYPVRLTRESIRAGTVIFDPDGHLAIVYKISADGLIHYIDAHPDNSLTRGIYGRDFARALPQMGAGFKRWRPQELVGATQAADGTLVGGKIVLKPDAELADWSDEQFYGTEQPRPKLWSEGKFVINGAETDYYDYLRVKLAGPGFKYDPVVEVRTRMRQLCDDLKERVDAVSLAVRAGYPRRPQPAKLPQNIYATSGDWEVYSTPSRDARLKTSFEELRDEVVRFIGMFGAHSALLNYAGSDLRADLKAIYAQESRACTFSYAKTDGTPKSLTFAEAMRRLFKMSFDPYHCVELRWGADSAEELATCPDAADKRAWYKAEDRLRNQLTRTYGEPMGFTLAQLQNQDADIGIADVPDIDIEKALDADPATDAASHQEQTSGIRNRRNQVAERRRVVPTGHRQ